jgi:N-methylhydantoinase A
MRALRIGIDIGGTFTDAILWDERGGAARVAKVSSTPGDPSIGFLRVARQILKDANAAPAQNRARRRGAVVARAGAARRGHGATSAPTGPCTAQGHRPGRGSPTSYPP